MMAGHLHHCSHSSLCQGVQEVSMVNFAIFSKYDAFPEVSYVFKIDCFIYLSRLPVNHKLASFPSSLFPEQIFFLEQSFYCTTMSPAFSSFN